MGKLFSHSVGKTQNEKKFSFKLRQFGGHLFGRMQNLSRAIVLPIAVLPIAGLLLGIGGGVASAIERLDPTATGAIGIFNVMKQTGSIVFANLGAIFAISIAFGFAKQSKGVAALSGFITFAVMSAVIAGLFFPYKNIAGDLVAGFDPWGLTKSSGGLFDEKLGVFKNVLGIPNTFDTSIFGGIIVGWLVSMIHNRTYNIKMPKVLGFFAGERFVPILAVFLGLGIGVLIFFAWPALFKAFQAIGSGMGSAMGFETNLERGKLTGDTFKPTVGGAFIALFFGMTERLLIPTGLHHVQYAPFWYTAVGGTWVAANGDVWDGAYNIFFNQFGAGSGHFNQTVGTMFMSGRFAFMQYGYPFAALAMWMLAKPENRKRVAGILGAGALTSFLTGITEPLLFSYLFVAPLCFVLHSVLAGISFMMAYCLNIVVGQGFAAGFIDFTIFGILPQVAFNQATGFYWIFATGLIMAPAYFFGFYYLIKWRNYKTLGREGSILESNLALQGAEAVLEKSTKKSDNKAVNLLNGLGGKNNILDLEVNDKILLANLKDIKLISRPLIRLSGTKTIKVKNQKIEITYLDGADVIEKQLQNEMNKKTISSKDSKNKSNTQNNDRLETIFKGLGGKDNVNILDNCATRLRVTVVDPNKVDEEILKSTGAIGVVKKGNAIQVIYGLEVGNIKNDLLTLWKI
ncbi:MAG: PTS transporter subunit EIIC [Spiroplasma sp.]|nr:PTS transporter subunit EIIC [Spiroplasma sp.]